MTERSQAMMQAKTQPMLHTDTGLLRRKCECGNAAGLTGLCSQCHVERATAQSSRALKSDAAPILHDFVQTKLAVGTPGDKYEQEADRIAEQVMRLPNLDFSEPGFEQAIAPTPLQRSPVQRLCPEDQDKVRRRHEGFQPAAPLPTLDRVESTLQKTGRPLDRATRDFFEPRFGVDFGHVRIHTDANAALSASDVRARAYTVGHNIVFNTGQYAPHTSVGQLLLAHELTHVVQQSLPFRMHQPHFQSRPGLRYDRSEKTTSATRFKMGRGVEQSGANLGGDSSIPGGLVSAMPLSTSPATIQRAIETYCLAPSEVPSITQSQAASFGRIAEVPIVMDYCRATGGCALMVSDYIDTDASSYIAFLAANNPHLTTQDILQLAIAATVTGGLSRPDVITHKPPRFEFEEVKPDSVSGRMAGRLKLTSLATLFARFSLPYLPGITWSGTGRLPLFTLPGGITVFLAWHRNLPGLVVYNLCVRGESSVLAAYGIVAILIAVILILLTRGRIIVPGGGAPLPIPAFASVDAPAPDRMPQSEGGASTDQNMRTGLS